MDLGSISYWYISYLLNPPHPLLLPSDVRLGGAAHSYPASPAIDICPASARGHPTTRESPVSVLEYLKTLPRLPLTRNLHIPTPPPLPRSCHAFQIPVAAAPLLPPKSLLTWPSAIFQLTPAPTTAPGVSAPPLIPYTLRITQRWAVRPPTSILSPVSFQCRS